jgi:DNA-binding NtrC family response regulator
VVKARILVIDDEEIIRLSTKRVLEPQGYLVKTPASVSLALSLVEQESWDLVLLDLKMPEMDGLEVLRKVKELAPETEVVIVTGYGTIQSAVSALHLGAYDYVEKPLNPDALTNAVRRALEHRALLTENLTLKREVRALYSLENIIGSSKAMQKIFDLIATVARVDSTVLITGESGTGKELVAKAIHYNSLRREGPFIVIDCVAIPDALLEAELFGHKKGSFTGAISTEKGLIELAQNGTLFFDEISNLPLSTQAKLLRVLQEKEFRPIGSRITTRADVRFIAATNRDLREMVRKGEFREDFFYRLNVFPIKLPLLRERREDIPALAFHFLKKYAAETGKDVEHISAEAMRMLIAADWPGNVRELENTIHRAVILAKSRTIMPEDIIAVEETGSPGTPRSLKELKEEKKRLRENSVVEVEKSFLLDALRENAWNISRAAQSVGMERTNFHGLMRKYGIRRERE